MLILQTDTFSEERPSSAQSVASSTSSLAHSKVSKSSAKSSHKDPVGSQAGSRPGSGASCKSGKGKYDKLLHEARLSIQCMFVLISHSSVNRNTVH